jgi:hypothetical protein
MRRTQHFVENVAQDRARKGISPEVRKGKSHAKTQSRKEKTNNRNSRKKGPRTQKIPRQDLTAEGHRSTQIWSWAPIAVLVQSNFFIVWCLFASWESLSLFSLRLCSAILENRSLFGKFFLVLPLCLCSAISENRSLFGKFSYPVFPLRLCDFA